MSNGRTEKPTKHKREYKDSVFVDYFGEDVSAKQNFISLYTALHSHDAPPTLPPLSPDDVKPLKLEGSLYTRLYNDVSYLVGGKIIFLAEHQSSVNENMPLRCLEYAARLYESIQSPRAKYYRTLQKIPSPEFYVFYNGLEEYPLKKTLRLSDAFMTNSASPPLELYVEVININADKNSPLLTECTALRDYSLFVDSVRRHHGEEREDGFEEAVRECIKNGIMSEYLERKSREVINMLIDEYDYDTDIAVRCEEAERKGVELGIELGRNEGIELGRNEGMELGEERGKVLGMEFGMKQTKLDTARLMKREGCDTGFISRMTGLSAQEIKSL